MTYYWLLVFHILSAAIWTGGHLYLALTVLPKALIKRDVSLILNFESTFEYLGKPVLIVQVLTGVMLANRYFTSYWSWFDVTNPISRVVQLKLLCLVGTFIIASRAQRTIIPTLSEETLNKMALHIAGVTVFSILFVLLGVSVRVGGI